MAEHPEPGNGSRKEPAEYVRDEADKVTDRELEYSSSKEAVQEEETGGALPRDKRDKVDESK